ncbi:MAG: hypothetical protein ACOCRK_00570 [bacterium]
MKKRFVTTIVFLILLIGFYHLPDLYYKEPDIEAAKKIIKTKLYEKYDEEFVIEEISRDYDEIEADVYKKSIDGTVKEDDSYYSGSASIDVLSFGRLGNVLKTNYNKISRNVSTETYLLPFVRKYFGKRVMIKVEANHEITGDGSWWANKYSSKTFSEIRQAIKKDSEKNRIMLKLYVHIFDRLDNETEKEKRRSQIFNFVQFLKKEGLFDYLELGVFFIDERVLAPSYDLRDIKYSDKVDIVVEGEEVELPTMKLRKKLSEKLQKEIDKMNEEELLANMKDIKKYYLSYDGMREYNCHYASWIYSIGMLEEEYRSSITDEDRERTYDKIEDVELHNYIKYIYLN